MLNDSLRPPTKRVGGGPRLSLGEWAALIAINRAHRGDNSSLTAALASASKSLTAIAANYGAARPGTKLRSVEGLRRRLTVVCYLEVGATLGLPAEARAAWALFVTDPTKAEQLVRDVLEKCDTVVSCTSISPSRGPSPSFGFLVSSRADGENRVYVMRPAGPSVPLLYQGSESKLIVKVGRSSNPERRQAELNWGLPPGCGLEWQLERDRAFKSAAEAHVFEQQLLARLCRGGMTIGGEYAWLTIEELATLLSGGLEAARGTAPVEKRGKKSSCCQPK